MRKLLVPITTSTPSAKQSVFLHLLLYLVHLTNSSLDCDSGIIHVTSDVGENLGLKSQLTNGLAILETLWGSSRAGEFDIVDTEVIEGLGDFDLLFSGEECGCELLTLAKTVKVMLLAVKDDCEVVKRT